MKTFELRDMSERDLREHITSARRELFGLRFQHATGELDNTSGLGAAKKEIARALTIAQERGIEIRG
jgi:large subunit ribosomal protein L29